MYECCNKRPVEMGKATNILQLYFKSQRLVSMECQIVFCGHH